MGVIYGKPYQIGGGGSSNSLKIYKSSAPPDVGKHEDVVLITEQNIPTSYTQPDEPSEKQIGDVWVVTGDGGVEVTLGKQPKITYSLLGAQQWNGAAWKPCKFCRKYTIFSYRAFLKKEDALKLFHGQPVQHAGGSCQYCPVCGRPLTEETWQQLKKRLKVLHEV